MEEGDQSTRFSTLEGLRYYIDRLHTYSEMGLEMLRVQKLEINTFLYSPGHKRKGSSKYEDKL